MRRKYIHLQNPFEIATRGSWEKMKVIANDHLDRLFAGKADPAILALYTPFLAEVDIYETLMEELESIEGMSKSGTFTWEEKLDEITKVTVFDWVRTVETAYGRNSAEVVAIFPNKKEPIARAPYAQRMTSLGALYKTLENYLPTLADLRTEVGNTVDDLKLTRQTQRGRIVTIPQKGSEVEAQRIVLANFMDNDLGRLKEKFRQNVDLVENYFNFNLLRKPAKETSGDFVFSGTAEAGLTVPVALPANLTMSTNMLCTFRNLSNTVELVFFFSAHGGATESPIHTTVLPEEVAEGTAAESGWAPGTIFLIVKNTGTVTADFELRVAKPLEE